MKLDSLTIERNPSYASVNPGQLSGSVTLTSDYGQQQIAISPGGIASIIRIISEEIHTTGKFLSKQVATTMEKAADEIALINSDGKLLEGDSL